MATDPARTGEPTLDAAALYREEIYTDRKVGTLRVLVPSASVIGFLINAGNPTSESQTRDVQVAARALGIELLVLNASSERSIDAAFASFVQQRVNAVIIGADSCLSVGAINWSGWRRVIRCPQSIFCASLPTLVD